MNNNRSSSISFRTANSGTTYYTARESLINNNHNTANSSRNVTKTQLNSAAKRTRTSIVPTPKPNQIVPAAKRTRTSIVPALKPKPNQIVSTVPATNYKNKLLIDIPEIYNKLKENTNQYDLENDEKILIDKNATPLVAMEHAAELLKQKIIYKGKFIEKVLEFITKTVPNTGFVSSKDIIDKNFRKNQKNITEYKKTIKAFQKELNKKMRRMPNISQFVSIVSNDMGDGAHYAACIYNKLDKHVTIFDSMQYKNKEGKTSSGFTNRFKEEIRKLFTIDSSTNLRIEIVNPTCDLSYKNCYQCTGGFVSESKNSPFHISKAYNKNNNVSAKALIANQDLDSQHHFCYMEALLFLTEKLHGYTRNTTYNRNTRIRLVAIKKFIWLLVNNRTILPRLSNTPTGIRATEWKYIKANFMCFWTDFNLTLEPETYKGSTVDRKKGRSDFKISGPLNFKRYEIPTTNLTNAGNNIQSILDKVHSGNTKNNFMRV